MREAIKQAIKILEAAEETDNVGVLLVSGDEKEVESFVAGAVQPIGIAITRMMEESPTLRGVIRRALKYVDLKKIEPKES